MKALVIAHAGHGLAAEAAGHWTWEPFTVALLVLSAAVYAIGIRTLWSRAGVGGGIARWQVASYGLGLVSLAVALLSPVAWLSEVLFSVHMTQHEILMLLSAPLLVFGHPLIVFLWAMPPHWRDRWGAWARQPRVVQMWRGVTAPLVVFLLHAVAIWVWHVPALYEAALRNAGVHAVEHLAFVLTAALSWWGMVHGRYGRIGYGLAVLYVFVTRRSQQRARRIDDDRADRLVSIVCGCRRRMAYGRARRSAARRAADVGAFRHRIHHVRPRALRCMARRIRPPRRPWRCRRGAPPVAAHRPGTRGRRWRVGGSCWR